MTTVGLSLWVYIARQSLFGRNAIAESELDKKRTSRRAWSSCSIIWKADWCSEAA